MKAFGKVLSAGVLACLLLAGLSACSSVSVTSDWDRNVDFSGFTTFALLEESQPSINRLVDERIRAALVAELTARGMRRVDTAEAADLAVGYQVTTEERVSYQTVHRGWSRYGSDWRTTRVGWGRHPATTTSTTRQVNFTVGTLIVAMFRTHDKELVWEGTGSRTVDPGGSPQQRDRRIREVVGEVLKVFPPPKDSS